MGQWDIKEKKKRGAVGAPAAALATPSRAELVCGAAVQSSSGNLLRAALRTA